MLPVRFPVNLARALLLLLAGALAPAVSAASYAGRPVGAVLQELQGPDLKLIFNSQLVPDGIRVLTEPAATGGIALVNEILAPHDLVARSVGTGIWAIVAGTPASTRRAPRNLLPGPLQEVIVTASQYELANAAPESRSFLTQEELRGLPKLADEPLRAVHRLPGAASNGVSGLAHIRGGEENETEIILDGLPLHEPFHLKSYFSPVSLLDAGIIDSLDVYAGGFPADYGGRMSAVVDVESIDPGQEGTRALGLSLFHLNALAGDTFAGGRGRWLASGRRSNLADVISIADSNLGAPRYLDAFLKTEFDPDDDTTLAAHALVAEDRISLNNSPETEFARNTDRNFQLWVTAEHRWSDELQGRALLAWTSVDNDRTGEVNDPGRRTGSVADARESRSVLLKVELEQGDDSLRWRAGLDAAWLRSSYNYASNLDVAAGFPFPGSPGETIVRADRLEPEGNATGAFLAARWRIRPALTAEAGLRWDNQTYDRVSGGSQLSPRANLLWAPAPGTEIRASWGRFFQPQGIDELQVEDGVSTFFPAQRADHLILSIEHSFEPGLSVRLEAYNKQYDELRPHYENLFDPLVLLPELQTDRVRVAPSAGDARGVELLLQKRSPAPWGWWFSYAWSRAEETINGADVPRSWDQRHSANGGVRWTGGRWDLALAGTWHTGWPTTPVSITAGTDPAVLVGDRNSARYDDFRSLDLRVGYSFRPGGTDLQAFLEVINLLARKNPCCVTWRVMDDGNGPPVLRRDEDNWPRLVPNLGILWKF